MLTLKRYLRSQNLQKWLAKRRVKLTAEHAAKRLLWARDYRNWSLTDWYRVIWSDESTVEKAGTARQRWVFGHPWEKWLPECCCNRYRLLVSGFEYHLILSLFYVLFRVAFDTQYVLCLGSSII